MTDIEVKRKELETAKRIRENGYYCGGLSGCKEMECPADPTKDRQDHCGVIYGKWGVQEWDDFIATREAELAELDKKVPTNADCTCMTSSEAIAPIPERLYPRAKGATGPTVDDFALALIHSGFYNPYEPDYAERTYGIAEKLKAESDRRRS